MLQCRPTRHTRAAVVAQALVLAGFSAQDRVAEGPTAGGGRDSVERPGSR